MNKNRTSSPVINYLKNTDYFLWLIIGLIALYSLLLLKSVTRATNSNYFSTQLFAVIVGLVAALVITFIGYDTISNYWFLIAAGSLFLMVYTILFGINISSSGGINATAWINLGGRTFQPSELVKICFIVTYAKHLSILNEKGTINQFKNILMLAFHAAVPVLLCHMQGDDGAGVVFFAIFISMSLASDIKLRYFILLGAVIVLAVPFAWNYILSDYQKLRFTAVYNLDDPDVSINEGYQQYQGRISIGSGGLFGKGLFHGNRVESSAVTFQHSDFIFSVAGEELGFVGCALIMLLLFVLMYRILKVGLSSKDQMGKYMCFGFFGLVALQSISNIGMCLAVLPVMGVTLPFFSAGGSSAACLYLGIGLIESVYINRNKKTTLETYKDVSYKKLDLKRLKIAEISEGIESE